MANRDHPNVGVQPGDVLAGKYRVERVLGVGGMGVVVAAHHIQLDEKVALKFLLPQALHSAESVARFVREARAAVKIKNEHVARVTDVGQLENGSPYIVMEYLEGSDLADWLKQRGALPIEQAVDFVLQTCEALADAHSLGIVHRDLKPANLFCIQRSDGQLTIKVLDFGISKITTPGAPGHDMTRTSALMGSPLYMSPEQMQLSKGVDARTDIWALGVILFELLTGQPPFNAEAVTQLAIKVANEPPPALRSFRFDAPEGLEKVVAKCLEKDRAGRFQTVGELAIALKDYGPKNARISVERVLGTLRQAGMSASVLPASGEHPLVVARPAAALAASVPQTDASWGQTAGPTATVTRPSGKVVLGVAIAAVLGVAVVGGALMMRGPGTSAGVPSAAVATPPPSPPTPAPTVPPSDPQASASAPVVPTLAVSALPAARPPAVTVNPGPVTPPARPAGSSPVVTPPPPAPLPAPAAPPAAPSPSAPAHKPNCNPPYIIDSAGNHQYKPECL
jgi:serine/threonine-protein kinase